MVAHQCDINGNLLSHLCSYIWYLINKNKWDCPSHSRNEIWHQRTNSPLTTGLDCSIEACLELCEKVDLRSRWYRLRPNGFLLYFPCLEVGQLCKNYHGIVQSLSSRLEWQGWRPVTLLVSIWLAESTKGTSVTLGRETIKCQGSKFPLLLSLSFNWFTGLYFEHTAEVTKGNRVGEHNRVCEAMKKK